MNEQQFGAKMEKDGSRVKKAVNTMVGDGVSQLKDEYDEFTGTARNKANETSSYIKKNVDSGMKRYNSKAQELADRLPYELSKSIRKYPWVVISLGLVFGFLLGQMLKPSRE